MIRPILRSVVLFSAVTVLAQQPKPATVKTAVRSQSTSTLAYSVDGPEGTVEITNVAYEIAGTGIPGRSKDERLVLRETTRTRQVLGEIGMEATTTVAAWPLGADLTQKPLYSVTVEGTDPKTLNGEVLVISRGLEEVEWWSIYKLGTGEHLFDTYAPILQFSTRRDLRVLRYVGLEIPGDDTPDARLKAPNVIGVLTYASAERVIREVLITADDAKNARLQRSYADSNRTIAFANGRITAAFSQNYPSAASTLTLSVPVAGDDLDATRSQAPAGIHVRVWKR